MLRVGAIAFCEVGHWIFLFLIWDEPATRLALRDFTVAVEWGGFG
jgi:hypothetical protein